MKVERYDAHQVLTPTGGFLEGYTHTFNPAIGCAFAPGACGGYCYAREFAERSLGAGSWGTLVRVKANAAELFERELLRASRRAVDDPHHVSRLAIFASSTTDPCAGEALEVTARVLEIAARSPLTRFVLQTRSPAVLKLRDALCALGERAALSFTLETDDEEIWRALGPPGAPSIAARRAAFEQTVDWPITRHLAISPSLPVRDPETFVDWVARYATHATVDTFVSGDGSQGRRTSRSEIPDRLAALGVDWRDEGAPRALLSRLAERMGARAAWSAEGFRALARRSPEGASGAAEGT